MPLIPLRCSGLLVLLLCWAGTTFAQVAPSAESVGMSTVRLARLSDAMDAHVAKREIAGAVTLVAKAGQVVHLHAAGFQDVESGKPLQPDSIFRLYSMTKPITAVTLLTLFEQGKFQLDDPLEKYIPEFANVMVYDGVDASGQIKLVPPEQKITVRHVLTHTGGISYGRGDGAVEKAYQAAGIAYGSADLQTLTRKIAAMPLLQQPGTRWVYSFSADIQAYLVEYFSGMSFDRYLQEQIFKPLGMSDTGFAVPADKQDRFASLYAPEGGLQGQPGIAVAMTVGLERLDMSKDAEYPQNGARPAGGSGLVSTAQDYFRFAQMLVNGGELDGARILSPRTVKLMTSPHVPVGFDGIPDLLLKGSGYGLGVSVLVDSQLQGNLGSNGQFGWSGAASTHVIMDPEIHMVSILMVQHRPALLALQKNFQTLVYQALLEP